MSEREKREPVTERFRVSWDKRFSAVNKVQGKEHPVLEGYFVSEVSISPLGPHGYPHELPFSVAELHVTYKKASELFRTPHVGYRRKLLRISNNFLPAMFGRDVRQFYEVCGDGLPPDTKVVNCRMGEDFRTLILCLESNEFAEVPESDNLPEIEPRLRTLELRPLSITGAN